MSLLKLFMIGLVFLADKVVLHKVNDCHENRRICNEKANKCIGDCTVSSMGLCMITHPAFCLGTSIFCESYCDKDNCQKQFDDCLKNSEN